ncbi:MAG: glycosyltransferase [Lachnospiraceae bacterium]|nr:glycosyltransferase [Lachnospiraceae bacterium]
MRSKRVLFVINTLGRGGAERSLINLLSQKRFSRMEVDLLILTGMGELVTELPPYVHVINRHVDRISVLSATGRLFLAAKSAASLLHGGYLIREHSYLSANYRHMKRNGRIRYDRLLWDAISRAAPPVRKKYDEAVAYIEGGSAYYVSRRVRAKKKTAIIHVDYRKAGYSRLTDGDIWKEFDRIGAVSEDTLYSFKKVYPELSDRLFIYENPLNKDRIKRLAEKDIHLHFKKNVLRIFTAMRLVPQKSPELSVNAAAILKEKGISFEWILAGDGEERSRLTSLIKEKGLSDCFILTGLLDNPYPLMKECDLYVQVTAFEGKSMSVREAMALGKTVMVTDTGSDRKDTLEIAVKPSPEALASAIISFQESRG